MNLDHPRPTRDHAARSADILAYWFASLDDASRLDPSAEPFRACYARWYGKQPAIDEEIRAFFERDLLAVTAAAPWRRELDAWASASRGLLALVLLLDQLPRNMYRGTPRMYAHDPLALSVATLAIREYEGEPLPLVQRMFLYVPLMHVEDRTVQRHMVDRFEELAREARHRSPHNQGFFERALGFARRHAEVVEAYGRFPHRNPILGRTSTPEEEEHLRGPDPGF
jgi:uncharacterized protein (DUF924 family)